MRTEQRHELTLIHLKKHDVARIVRSWTAWRPPAPWKPSAARPRTPIIMLSANALTSHREQSLAAGADLHVAKPITAANLLAGIQATVGKD